MSTHKRPGARLEPRRPSGNRRRAVVFLLVATLAFSLLWPALPASLQAGAATQDFTVTKPVPGGNPEGVGYPTAADGAYFTVDSYFDGAGEFEDARFLIVGGGSLEAYIAFCAEYWIANPDPKDKDTYVLDPFQIKDHTASALAVAIAHKDYGAKLSIDEFNKLFPSLPDVSPSQRFALMSVFVWAYEYYAIGGIPESDIANPYVWNDPVIGPLYDELFGDTKLIGAELLTHYPGIAAEILKLAGIYSASPGLSASGTASITAELDAGTGKLTVKRLGYPGATASTETDYSLSLSWTGSAVTVTKNGAVQTSSFSFTQADNIYIHKASGTGATTITVTEAQAANLSLVNGSIRGDRLKTATPNRQDLLTGYAEFGVPKVTADLTAPAPGSTSITFSKTIAKGSSSTAEIPAGDSLSCEFKIYKTDAGGTVTNTTALDTATVSGTTGAFSPTAKDFSLSVSGLVEGNDYYYKITETFSLTNWTKAGDKYIKVSVTAPGVYTVYVKNSSGNWVAESATNKTFTNTYSKAAPVTTLDASVRGYKYLRGAYRGSSTSFKLSLVEVTDTGAVLATPHIAAQNAQSVTSGSHKTFTLSGLPRAANGDTTKYYFKVTEDDYTDANWVKDPTDPAAYYVMVEIPGQTSGSTTIYYTYYKGTPFTTANQVGSRTSSSENENIKFYNIYKKADYTLAFDKEIAGAYAGSDIEFEFELYREIDPADVDEFGNYGGLVTPVTVKAVSHGSYTVYGKDVGEYYYLVKEKDIGLIGWVYDADPLFIKVVVAADGTNGALKATVTNPYTDGGAISEAKDEAVFTNTYENASLKVSFTKKVTGYTAAKEFRFDVVQVTNYNDYTPVPGGFEMKGIRSTGSASVRTHDILLEYESKDIHPEGQTFYYMVTETAYGFAGGWEYSDNVWVFEVYVEHDGAALVVTGPDEDPNFTLEGVPVFENKYFKGTATLRFNKAYADPTADYPNKVFSYVLQELEQTNEDLEDPTVEADFPDKGGPVTKTSAGKGEKSFVVADLLPGDHFFRITEKKNDYAKGNAEAPDANWDGWDHGTDDVLYVKVKVVADGTINYFWWDGYDWVAEADIAADARTITNTYSFTTKGSGTIVLGGDKKIEADGPVPDNPAFGFSLKLVGIAAGPAKDPGNPPTEAVPGIPDPNIERAVSAHGSKNGSVFTFPQLRLQVDHRIPSAEYLDYTFEITEDDFTLPGWTTDPAVYHLTVRVWGYPTVVAVSRLEKNGALVRDYTEAGAAPYNFTDLVFVNNYEAETGSLTLRKAVTGEYNDWAVNDGTLFTARIKDVISGKYLVFDAYNNYLGSSANGTPVKFSAERPVTLNGLPAERTYLIEEEEVPGHYAASYTSSNNIMLAGGANTVTVTNSYEPGTDMLVVQKLLEGDYGMWGADENTIFEIVIKDVSGNNYMKFPDGLKDGVYHASGSNGKDTLAGADRIAITAGQPVIITGLWPNRVYEVVELVPDGSSYKVSYEGNRVYLPEDESRTVQVINTYNPGIPGALTIKKKYAGHYTDWGVNSNTVFQARVRTADGAYLTFDEDNAYTGASQTGTYISFSQGSPATLSGIPADGRYTVEEAGSYQYEAGYNGFTGVLNPDINNTVTVTNTYAEGTDVLIVSKELTGSYADWGVNSGTVFQAYVYNATYGHYVDFPDGKVDNQVYHARGYETNPDWVKTIEISAGQPVSLLGLWPGCVYDIIEVESALSLYTATTSGPVALPEGGVRTITVTNRYRPGEGSLIISKKLTGGHADWGAGATTEYTAQVKDATTGVAYKFIHKGGSVYELSTLPAAKADITFSQGASAVITGLDVTKGYKVEETGGARYTASYSSAFSDVNGAVSLSDEENVIVTVTNDYEHAVGVVVVEKVLGEHAEHWDIDDSTVFTIYIKDVTNGNYLKFPYDPVHNEYYCDGNNNDPYSYAGATPLYVTAAQPIVITNLWANIDYEVLEVTDDYEHIASVTYAAFDLDDGTAVEYPVNLPFGGNKQVVITNNFNPPGPDDIPDPDPDPDPPTPPGPTPTGPTPTPPGPTPTPTPPGPTTSPDPDDPSPSPDPSPGPDPDPDDPEPPTPGPGPIDPDPYEPDDFEEPPYIPGGRDHDTPPLPLDPNHTLVYNEEFDLWLELDEDGVPLGAWYWDEDEEEWLWLDLEDIPLGGLDMPTTDGFWWPALFIPLGILLVASGVVLLVVRRRRKSQ